MTTIDDHELDIHSKNLNRFIAKLYRIVNSDEPTVRWVPGGKRFLILDPKNSLRLFCQSISNTQSLRALCGNWISTGSTRNVLFPLTWRKMTKMIRAPIPRSSKIWETWSAFSTISFRQNSQNSSTGSSALPSKLRRLPSQNRNLSRSRRKSKRCKLNCERWKSIWRPPETSSILNSQQQERRLNSTIFIVFKRLRFVTKISSRWFSPTSNCRTFLSQVSRKQGSHLVLTSLEPSLLFLEALVPVVEVLWTEQTTLPPVFCSVKTILQETFW